MPCYNADRYIADSVHSIIDQSLSDWELIIVNDGSTDQSESVALQFSQEDKRIRVVSKENGGYVSARIYGYSLTGTSKYIIFYDADDKMHPDMLWSLANDMEMDEAVGAVYCDHVIMDEHGTASDRGIDMQRYIPTRFWLKKVDDAVVTTPFISIFCWTKMIEPMTLIRRIAYDQTPGWDISFGKGLGNIGEGVYLFSEIALQWKVHYINLPLYYYRRHSEQISAIAFDKMLVQVNKVIGKWTERIKHETRYVTKVKPAIVFLKYRLSVKQRLGSMKYQLRYQPFTAVKSFFLLVGEYIASISLVFTYRRIID
jgi:glycosyltransferase involved in cell wall biosynthesis